MDKYQLSGVILLFAICVGAGFFTYDCLFKKALMEDIAGFFLQVNILHLMGSYVII